MTIRMQGKIPLKGPVSLFPSVNAFGEILLRTSCHVVYVSWTKVVIIYELISHFYVTVLLGWLQIRP